MKATLDSVTISGIKIEFEYPLVINDNEAIKIKNASAIYLERDDGIVLCKVVLHPSLPEEE